VLASIGRPVPEFPYPAVKVVVGQYLYISRRPPFWAWLIVGGFYDTDGNELWHTEIYLRQGDLRGWSFGLPDRGPSLREWDADGEFHIHGSHR